MAALHCRQEEGETAAEDAGVQQHTSPVMAAAAATTTTAVAPQSERRTPTATAAAAMERVGMVLYHQTQPMTQEVMTQVMTRAVTQSLCAPRQCAFPIPGRRRIAVRDVSRRSCGGHDERAEHGSIVRTGCAVGHAERHAERHGGLE